MKNSEVQALWRQRFERYAKEAIGYWQYAARSNFIGFLLFLVIVSSYYYAKSLQQIPTNYPYVWIVLLILAPLLTISPIRTLLKEADRMFLLRIELQMGVYFRQAFFYSFMMQSFYAFVALSVLWPLYLRCAGPQAQSYLLMLIFLLLVKGANLLASWHENRFVDIRIRAAAVSFRWIATTTAIWLQFSYGVLWAGGSILAFILVWLAAARMISTYRVRWDTLIEKEKQQQARLYAFFNWFVDVPQLPTRVRGRGWIAGVTNLYPFSQPYTYFYLMTKTLLRSELFGMFLKVTFIGITVVFAVSSDIARTAAFLVTTLITTVQLSSLGHAHQYSTWLWTYPLMQERKGSAVLWNIGSALLAQNILLSIPYFLRAESAYWIVPFLDLGLISFICGVILRRKLRAAI